MSWPWQRTSVPRSTLRLRPASDRLEMIDPSSLEVVELDGEGRLHAPERGRPPPDLREIGYAPRRRDPTGVAGLWEALNGP